MKPVNKSAFVLQRKFSVVTILELWDRVIDSFSVYFIGSAMCMWCEILLGLKSESPMWFSNFLTSGTHYTFKKLLSTSKGILFLWVISVSIYCIRS